MSNREKLRAVQEEQRIELCCEDSLLKIPKHKQQECCSHAQAGTVYTAWYCSPEIGCRCCKLFFFEYYTSKERVHPFFVVCVPSSPPVILYRDSSLDFILLQHSFPFKILDDVQVWGPYLLQELFLAVLRGIISRDWNDSLGHSSDTFHCPCCTHSTCWAANSVTILSESTFSCRTFLTCMICMTRVFQLLFADFYVFVTGNSLWESKWGVIMMTVPLFTRQLRGHLQGNTHNVFKCVSLSLSLS